MWRIDKILASHGPYEACLCSLDSSNETETHFCKRYVGNRFEPAFRYFTRHASIATTIAHPNLNALRYHDLNAARPNLVFERIDGMPLDAWLNHQTQIPEQRQLLRIACQLLASLQILHQLGYVHGNIRPEHVLIGERDALTLVGCGSCEEVGHCVALSKSVSRYDAPEVHLGEYEASSAQDIFAAGMILAELFGGGPKKKLPIVEAMQSPSPDDRPFAGELVRLLQELELALHGEPSPIPSFNGNHHSFDRAA